MGIIYQNAAIVIVAAAGKDPSHGLPGVSKRARVQQRSMVKGDYKFMEMYLDLKHTLRRTEWISRAWYVSRSIDTFDFDS